MLCYIGAVSFFTQRYVKLFFAQQASPFFCRFTDLLVWKFSEHSLFLNFLFLTTGVAQARGFGEANVNAAAFSGDDFFSLAFREN